MPDYFPDWIRRVEVPKRDGTVTHVLACDADTLVYLVGQNTITPHVWLSRADRIQQPDRLVIDLDPPPGSDFARSGAPPAAPASCMRELGSRRSRRSPARRASTSGLRCAAAPDFERGERVRERRSLRVLAARHPDELTTEFRKAKRGGRILVDVARNRYAQTAVPPYAVRPRPGAPVATPIEWDELSDSRLRPDRWTSGTCCGGSAAKGDPWADIQSYARGISRARRRSSPATRPERFRLASRRIVAAMSFDSSR